MIEGLFFESKERAEESSIITGKAKSNLPNGDQKCFRDSLVKCGQPAIVAVR